MTPISVIVPVYNAQFWLSRFAASLQSQTFTNFEILFIDDASTDQSAALIEDIAAADSRIRLIRLPKNSGAGVARNIGIRNASGETLCFADPDDLLPNSSLEVRYAAYKRHNAIVRACHDEIEDDGTLRSRETRLDKLPETFSPAAEAPRVGVNPFLCAHWTWLFPTALLRRYAIFNGEGMRTAEDIVLLNRLFFHIGRMVWIPDTVYYWMKHKGSLSTTKYTAKHYEDYFQCCDIFYEEADQHGRPELGDLFFDNYLALYPAHMLAQISQGHNDEHDAQIIIETMADIAGRHKVFQRCMPAMRNNPAHHAGLFRLWTILQSRNPSAIARLVESQQQFGRLIQERRFEAIRTNGWSQKISFDKLDSESDLLRARYLYSETPPVEHFLRDGKPQMPAYAKTRGVYAGHDFRIFERILWLYVPAGEEAVFSLTIAGQKTGLNHTPAQLKAAFEPRPLDDRGFPPDIRALRHLARSCAIHEKFRDAWLFIDKDTEADDNAEHLYRWVRRHHPEINAWYVLGRNSHDWSRLETEGFRLAPHGEMEHHALFLNCVKLISSQMDRYIFQPLDERYVTDFPRPQFVCLPHGVTKDDVSDWFNSIPFDIFIAATHSEARSITEDGSPYVMTKKEVRLGGFPRYDKWLEPVEKENIIFVMPTWRADLVGEWNGKGQKRAKNPHFQSSKFVHMWKELFDDPRLKALVSRHGYRVVFFAHPCFEIYLDDMPFPDYVEKRSKNHGSMIDIMQRCKIMITDFSSVAYDMAYMRKPVLYYQYESKADFTRSQKWVSGYIDYETMGFGPVCRDIDTLIRRLDEACASDGVIPDPYRTRAENTFAFHDANCCRRAYEFIAKGSRPNITTQKDV